MWCLPRSVWWLITGLTSSIHHKPKNVLKEFCSPTQLSYISPSTSRHETSPGFSAPPEFALPPGSPCPVPGTVLTGAERREWMGMGWLQLWWIIPPFSTMHLLFFRGFLEFWVFANICKHLLLWSSGMANHCDRTVISMYCHILPKEVSGFHAHGEWVV